jgi:hypothetical protein
MLRCLAVLLAPALFPSPLAFAQGFGQLNAQLDTQTTAPTAPRAPMPLDYRGVQTHIDGIWVTPVPNAPFTANVQVVSHQVMPDGTERVVKTENLIARSSSGRIRNERRQLVPATFNGKPRLISAHLYDPNSGENIYTEPMLRIARKSILARPSATPPAQRPPEHQRTPPGVTVTPLGDQSLDGVTLTGTRKTRTISAEMSGTGKPVTITDDYWYSPELSIYLIIKHDDPRTGEQLVAVTHVQRAEPPAEMMQVPDGYKLVDETPPPPSANETCHADYC